MTLTVHFLHPLGDERRAHLEQLLNPGVSLSFGDDLPRGADFEVLVAGRPTRRHLEASPRLRALVIPWTGVPPETRDLVQDMPDITLYNIHFGSTPVAEHALGLLLAAAKSLIPADQAMRRGDWTMRYERVAGGILLEGKTALILGYGDIAEHLTPALHGLNMHVIGVKRHVAESVTHNGVALYPPGALHALLPRATALIICLPHTTETEGMIGAAELALLPEPSVLVNVGRGAVVDEGALYRALRDGKLYAAGIDVWYNYPEDEAARTNTQPSAYPFHELDHVVMSPHRAPDTMETERLRMQHLAKVLNALARGQDEIPNRVDITAGY